MSKLLILHSCRSNVSARPDDAELARPELPRNRIRAKLGAAAPLLFVLLRFTPEEALLLRGIFDLIWSSGRIGPLRFR